MILAIMIPLLFAFATPFLAVFLKRHWNLAILGTFLSLAVIVNDLPKFMARTVLFLIWQAPPYGIVLQVDAFNGLTALLLAFVFFLTAVYSVIYMKGKENLPKFYALFLLLFAATMGVVLTGDLFNMFVFFEILSISSYALVAYAHTKKAFISATQFLILGSLGTSLFLLGITFMYALTGTLNIADMALKAQLVHSPLLFAAMALFFVGAGVKAAIVPFHLWKPGAVGDAPVPVSMLLTTASTTLGLYVICRTLFTVFFSYNQLFCSVLLAFGALTMTVGAFMALVEPDLKRLLAYSGVSQVGYVLLALGLGTYPGAFAALFHLFNFVVSKALLFMAAGMVIVKTGESNLNRLRGLCAHMPLTAVAFLIGALATAGLPPLNGFLSKWFIYKAALAAGHPLLAALALIVSAVTLAYYLRAFSAIFMGPSEKMRFHADPHYLLPIILLAFVCVLVGVLPELVTPGITVATQSLLELQRYVGVLG